MRRPRIHLIECLDSAGAAPADAQVRSAALESLGATVRAVTVRDQASQKDDTAAWEGEDSTILTLDAAGRETLRRGVLEGHADRVVVASASPGGGAVARAIPAGLQAAWWPAGTWGARAAAGGFPSIAPGVAGPHALDWAVVDAGAVSRRRLPLWDGDYVLAPAPLEGRAGAIAIEAFATIASDWNAVDLVVLGHPERETERQARELGIATRVHFVGPAPREAEWAWWCSASAAVLGGSGALSGGLVLRGLVAGCPLVVAGPLEGSSCGEWLVARGALSGRGESHAHCAASLELALESAPVVRQAIARGREAAAQQTVEAMSDRLRAMVPALGRQLEAA